jgi:CheY-like chemotaxis protein
MLASSMNEASDPMKTNTDQESHTSWFRRFFGKPATPTTPPVAPPPPPKPARHQKVLVVDDDPLFLKIARTLLTQEGFEVLTAADGCEAIEAARKAKPHVLVLDVNLPTDVTGVAWDGYRIVSWLRHFDALKHIPIVMTSSGDPAQTTRAAMQSGATAFFHKRMQQTQLVNLVNQALLRRTPPAPSEPATVIQPELLEIRMK